MTAALAALLLSAGTVGAVTVTPFNTNLVKNPGAEAGVATSDGLGVPIPGWETISDSNFTVVKYGELGGPSKAQSNAINGGRKFFFAGKYDAVYGQCDDAIQNIKLNGRNAQIDGRHVKVTLSAWLDSLNSDDLARVTLTFGDDTNNVISRIRVGAQGPTAQFVHRSVSVTVPAHTRQVTVRMYDAGSTTDYCDAFFDKISVKLVQI
jgi:hypothetical protein